MTHLAYADHLLLFAQGDCSLVTLLISCLDTFGDMAGLQINKLKLYIHMAGVSDQTKRSLMEVIRFQEGQMPFRYLGVPLASTKLKIFDYSPLVDSIVPHINS